MSKSQRPRVADIFDEGFVWDTRTGGNLGTSVHAIRRSLDRNTARSEKVQSAKVRFEHEGAVNGSTELIGRQEVVERAGQGSTVLGHAEGSICFLELALIQRLVDVLSNKLWLLSVLCAELDVLLARGSDIYTKRTTRRLAQQS